jgi:hypothetical protein
MTIYITTRFNDRGEAHIDESQLANLHFDTNLEKINELVTNTIYLKSEDKELTHELKQLANTQS